MTEVKTITKINQVDILLIENAEKRQLRLFSDERKDG